MLNPQMNSRGAVKHRPRFASVAEPTISPDSLLEGDGFEPSIPSCDRPSANSRGPITRAKIPALIRFGHVIQRRRLDVRNRRGLRREQPARRLETRAWPSPCTTPPWIWPLRSIGFTTVPTSTCRAEPEVRIQFPPAESPLRTDFRRRIPSMAVNQGLLAK